jgi:hypothetical protein
MAYKPPFNPQVISPGRFRRFSGVSGEPTKVIKVSDSNGRDLSDSFANDQFDLNSDKKGELKLREGFIKIGDGVESSIGSIFQIFLGGNLQYGFVDVELDIYDIPPIPYPNVPLPPEDFDEELPDDFPPSFPIPNPMPTPPDDAPPADPSVPPDGQTCEDHHTHSTSPETLNFTMAYGVPPSNQSWYWMIRGWWPKITHYGTYSVRPAWYRSYEVGQWEYTQKYCDAIQQVRVVVQITGKDSSGEWLTQGTYTNAETLRFTDGDTHIVNVSLIVYQNIMALESTTITLKMTNIGGLITWSNIVVKQTLASATLNWTAALTTDNTVGKLSLSPASGDISGIGSDDIVLSTSLPIDAGTYNGNIVKVSGDGSPSSIDATVNLEVISAPTTSFSVHSVWTLTWAGGEVWTGDYVYAMNYVPSQSSYVQSGSPYENRICLDKIKYLTSDPGDLYGTWDGPGWYVYVSANVPYVTSATRYKCRGKVTLTCDVNGIPTISFSVINALSNYGGTIHTWNSAVFTTYATE